MSLADARLSALHTSSGMKEVQFMSLADARLSAPHTSSGIKELLAFQPPRPPSPSDSWAAPGAPPGFLEQLAPCRNAEAFSRIGTESVSAPTEVMTSRAAARNRAKAFQRASWYYQAGDLESFYETLTVASLRNSKVAVTLANPSLPDIPLVGVSRGFEEMTGYSRSEILGRNCRFLSIGCPVPAETRHQMRLVMKSDKWFRGILPNRRKNGEVFSNLLHMCWIKVGNCLYVLGLQADVTHMDPEGIDRATAEQMAELDRLVDAIFAANVDAWAALQNAEFKKGVELAPYVETMLVPRYTSEQIDEARRSFVVLGPGGDESGTRVRYFNTFIDVDQADGQGPLLSRLRKVASEPDLGSTQVADMPRLPLSVMRETLSQLMGSPLPGYTATVSDRMDVKKEREEDDEEEQLAHAPPTASKGSTLHPNGCTPCSFHCYSHMGCNKGEMCEYCHMDHPKRARRRGKKKSKGLMSDGQASCWPEDTYSLPDVGCRAQAVIEDTIMEQPLPQKAAWMTKPTPAALMPLLEALELLSPLPATDESSAVGDWQRCKRAADRRDRDRRRNLSSSSSENGSFPTRGFMQHGLRHGSTLVREGRASSPRPSTSIELIYNEDSIVIAPGQWKQVVPFVRGPPGPLIFAVAPPLPAGLFLRRDTGIISGCPMQLTPLGGVLHRVTATKEGRGGRGMFFLRVRVVTEREASDEEREEAPHFDLGRTNGRECGDLGRTNGRECGGGGLEAPRFDLGRGNGRECGGGGLEEQLVAFQEPARAVYEASLDWDGGLSDGGSGFNSGFASPEE